MSIELVRIHTGDLKQYQSATSAGDGVNEVFKLPNAPIYQGTTRVLVNSQLKVVGVDYTVNEEAGLVTFTTPPVSGAVVSISSMYTMISDASIQALLDQYSDDDGASKLAAADALDIIASNEAMIVKRIEMLDLKTDGPAVADSLRKHAKALRDAVASALDIGDFDIIEMVYDPYSWREMILKDLIRGS